MFKFVVFCVLALPAAAEAAQQSPLCPRFSMRDQDPATFKDNGEQSPAFVISIDGIRLPDEATGMALAEKFADNGACPATS